jgi:HlyD family secretion protein
MLKLKLDPTVSTLSAAGVLAIATSVMLNWAAASIGQQTMSLASDAAHAADAPNMKAPWAASSTGRVEPKDGEIRITAQAPGKIVEVVGKTNDKVAAGDLLVLLDDDDLTAKLTQAVSEALVREREREEEPVKGLALDRRVAEDTSSASDRALFRARLDLDIAMRKAKSGELADDAVTAVRDKLAAAEKKAAADRDTLEKVSAKDGMPLPTRLESALTSARADISQVETAIEKTRIRAPTDGTVLNVWAKVGETATPSSDTPLVLFGDISSLRVRAEVEERDVVKIRVGQRAVVRADAFPDRDFEGVVTQLAPALGPPRITTRGPRRPNDVEVLEVLISLDGLPPLLTGMRVDAFFKNDSSAGATSQPTVTSATPSATAAVTTTDK